MTEKEEILRRQHYAMASVAILLGAIFLLVGVLMYVLRSGDAAEAHAKLERCTVDTYARLVEVKRGQRVKNPNQREYDRGAHYTESFEGVFEYEVNGEAIRLSPSDYWYSKDTVPEVYSISYNPDNPREWIATGTLTATSLNVISLIFSGIGAFIVIIGISNKIRYRERKQRNDF